MSRFAGRVYAVAASLVAVAPLAMCVAACSSSDATSSMQDASIDGSSPADGGGDVVSELVRAAGG